MDASEKRTSRATLLVIASSCGFGSISVLTTRVIHAGTPLVPAMFWRYLVALLLLLLTMGGPAKAAIGFTRAARLVVIGGGGQALIAYFSLRALDYIPVGPLAFLFYTYPAWVAVIAAARGIERLTPVKVGALVLAFSGIALMIGSPFAKPLHIIGVALALGSAMAYGAYLPIINSVQRGIAPMVSAFYIVAGAMVTFLVGSAVTGTLAAQVSGAAWIGILLLATVSTVIAFSALIAGLDVLGPVRTAIVAMIEPFYTAVLGAIVLREALTVDVAVGGALIAAAVIMIQRAGPKLS